MDDYDEYTPMLEPYGATTPRERIDSCVSSIVAALSGFFGIIHEFFASSFIALWSLATKEPARTIHSLKMGLALFLSFLLVLLDFPYTLLGSHVIWAIMTVILVFEYTTGASLSKGCNRGVGTLLAGLLAVLIGEWSDKGGSLSQPIMVGLSAFVIGGVVDFAKLLPTLKAYQYGFQTFLLTFSLIMVAEYRDNEPVNTAVNRFIVILVGAAIGLSVNIFLLPLWAGEELHELISKNFDSLADSLEVCVNEYLRGAVLERIPSKIMMGLAADDPVYKGYRSILISASKEETLAGFAIWEPPHGRFRMLNYPWQNYVKVGAILRHCTYSVVTLHGCLRSALQAPLSVRTLFEDELRNVSKEGAEVLRKLGAQVCNMQKGDPTTVLDGVCHAVEHLQHSLNLHSYLLVRQETGISEDSCTKDLPFSVAPEIEKTRSGDHLVGAFQACYVAKLGIDYPHDESNDSSRRGYKKLHSWPYKPIDDFDFDKDSVLEQKVRVLESASALSLGTFATLLMEVAVRLDYLVEAVEELGELANFAEAEQLQMDS